ncbi:hypothetical protein AURANDRAFT_66358 [Aureococcus anophagefferens]|uniref:Uncharacterized protein n=1 Tax=Aureococcus anophagefferens TaxID=44056 RepID=F0YH21_AURAN|nr:hypothetical protein AURANDRAFT_66358 [Aureococcus anophagefferens]EGB05587.1 hypothetical protein AURANDRAFT_66358 [Aureococcus anophagefferens]|eukprot:XP_009039718.1 hypothetical protein AURANDRAFT_66358 [Aureococcus anophagefferens]
MAGRACPRCTFNNTDAPNGRCFVCSAQLPSLRRACAAAAAAAALPPAASQSRELTGLGDFLGSGPNDVAPSAIKATHAAAKRARPPTPKDDEPAGRDAGSDATFRSAPGKSADLSPPADDDAPAAAADAEDVDAADEMEDVDAAEAEAEDVAPADFEMEDAAPADEDEMEDVAPADEDEERASSGSDVADDDDDYDDDDEDDDDDDDFEREFGGRGAAPATRDAAERDALMLTDSPPDAQTEAAVAAAEASLDRERDALVDLTDSPPDAQTEAAVAAAEASLDRERDALIDLTDSPEDLGGGDEENAPANGSEPAVWRPVVKRPVERPAAKRPLGSSLRAWLDGGSAKRRGVGFGDASRPQVGAASLDDVSRPWVGAASLDDASLDDARPAARLEDALGDGALLALDAALCDVRRRGHAASLDDASLDDARPAALLEDALSDGARLRAFGDALRNSRTDDDAAAVGRPAVRPAVRPAARPAARLADALGDGARRGAAFGALGDTARNSRPAARRVDMSRALCNPSRHELLELVDVLLRTGLWKVGGCYEDQIDIRPFSSTYEPEYYYRQGAILLAYGLVDTARAEQLETAALQRAKFELGTGVNTKDRDGLPHDNYSSARPGALYAVPVRTDVATTQEEFKRVFVSYYLKLKGGKKKTTYEEGRQQHENTLSVPDALATLKEHFEASQLERVFVGGRKGLNVLARPYLQEPDGDSAIGDALKKLTKSREDLFNEGKYTHVKELYFEETDAEGRKLHKQCKKPSGIAGTLSVPDTLATLKEHFKPWQLASAFSQKSQEGTHGFNALARRYLQEPDGDSAIGDALKKITKSRKNLFNYEKYTRVKELYLEEKRAERECNPFAC